VEFFLSSIKNLMLTSHSITLSPQGICGSHGAVAEESSCTVMLGERFLYRDVGCAVPVP
jgi:hypothetical protein